MAGRSYWASPSAIPAWTSGPASGHLDARLLPVPHRYLPVPRAHPRRHPPARDRVRHVVSRPPRRRMRPGLRTPIVGGMAEWWSIEVFHGEFRARQWQDAYSSTLIELAVTAGPPAGNGTSTDGASSSRWSSARAPGGKPSAPSRPSRPRLMPCPIRSTACLCTGGAGAGPARRHRAGRGRPQGRGRWPGPSPGPGSGPASPRQPLLDCATWPDARRDGITEGRQAGGWPVPLNRGSVGTRSGRGQDGAMRDMQATADGLRSAIERSGYYPGLVADAVSSALGSEAVVSFFVHHDALFDPAMEVRRHMSVLVLTPTRLIYSHTDENPAEDPSARPQAETSTEAVRFSRISSVAVTRVVSDPASYVPGVTMPSEVVLTIGWNVLSHVELEPAHCGDENCEADHGYSGTITADDLALRVSEAADGEEAVRQVLAFASALGAATAHPDR